MAIFYIFTSIIIFARRVPSTSSVPSQRLSPCLVFLLLLLSASLALPSPLWTPISFKCFISPFSFYPSFVGLTTSTWPFSFFISQIFANIVNNPTEEKFQRVPADNKKFVENVGDRKGGKSFLIAAGWLKKAIEHREFWVVNKQNDQWMEAIQTALHILEEKHSQFLRLAEEERLKDEKQKKLDAERSAIAMKQYDDVRPASRNPSFLIMLILFFVP